MTVVTVVMAVTIRAKGEALITRLSTFHAPAIRPITIGSLPRAATALVTVDMKTPITSVAISKPAAMGRT